MRTFLAPIMFMLSFSTTASAEYSPRDFLSQAPAETFYTEDSMTEDQKRAVLASAPNPPPTFNCEAWGIAEQSPNSLVLQICPDSFVRIQLFRQTSGDTIVAVESNRSAGCAVDLTFFKVVGNTGAITKLSDGDLTALGLVQVSENDLLPEDMKFPSGKAEILKLGLDTAGRPTALVSTWMNPRWETKTQAFDIVFEWAGARFRKKVEKRT
jgi:hypothetical protein